MAVLKGPLFSLGASQQLGKALVFFPWKGLNVVREYVIPANPNTTLQQTQRGHLKVMVADIHAAQAAAAHPLDETDTMAYATWAGVVKAATTWFNQAVKAGIDRLVAGEGYMTCRGGKTTPAATSLAVELYSSRFNPAWCATGKFMYGTSKTALINTQGATPALPTNKMSATIAGLTSKTKYYWQFEGLTGAGWLGAKSGIYHGTTT